MGSGYRGGRAVGGNGAIVVVRVDMVKMEGD